MLADVHHYKGGEFALPAGTTDQVLTARLERASRVVRAECPGIDERIAAGTLDPDVAADVVCEMVESAISSEAGPGVSSVQQGTGPFQETLTFSNPRGDLFLTSRHKRMLKGGKSGRRPFTVSVMPSRRT